MACNDFPLNPVLDDIYDTGTQEYRWDGFKWVTYSGEAVGPSPMLSVSTVIDFAFTDRVTCPLATVVESQEATGYLAADGVGITVLKDCLAMVSYEFAVGLNVPSNNETTAFHRIAVNGAVNQFSKGYSYHGNTDTNITSAATSVPMRLTAGDQITYEVAYLVTPTSAACKVLGNTGNLTVRVIDQDFTRGSPGEGWEYATDPNDLVNINSGNVGIGVDAPYASSKLTVIKGPLEAFTPNGDADVVVGGTGSGGINIISGALGVPAVYFGDVNTPTNGVIAYSNTDNSMAFSTNGDVEKMRISDDGDITIGKEVTNVAIQGVTLFANGVVQPVTTDGNAIIANRLGTTGTVQQWRLNGANISQVLGTGAYQQLSDANAKEDVTPIPYGLDSVLSLNPVEFQWKGGDTRDIGFIAQEVKPVIPHVVSQEEEEGTLGIAYANLVPVLVKAIQELTARVKELEKF